MSNYIYKTLGQNRHSTLKGLVKKVNDDQRSFTQRMSTLTKLGDKSILTKGQLVRALDLLGQKRFDCLKDYVFKCLVENYGFQTSFESNWKLNDFVRATSPKEKTNGNW